MGDHGHYGWRSAARWLSCMAAAALLTACGGYGGNNSSYNPPATPPTPPASAPPPTASAYSMTSLVSDGAVAAAKTDANLKNPWGLVMAPGLPAWVANNATQTATIYDGTGQIQTLVVALPGGVNGAADVTGLIFNPFTTTHSTEFVLSNGTVSAPARFI